MRGKNRGFTLVELSIVMVIIALLVGSVFAGNALIEASRIKSTISQIEEFQSSFNVFVDKFSAYPGDFSRADRFLGVSANEVGTGDTQIVWADSAGTPTVDPAEGPLAWYHMQVAGLVVGQFGTDLITGNAVPTIVVPVAKIGGDGGGFFIDYDSAVGGLGNQLGIGLYDPVALGINNAVLLTPRQTFDIDKKLDDTYPTSGLVRGNENPVASGLCFDTASPAQYVLTSENVGCYLTYKLD